MACALLGLIFLFTLELSSGQWNVMVPKGPMVRANGYNITIWCNVSGYPESSEPNFEWSVYLPSAPEREIQIVSMKDASFTYAVYQQRVTRREVYIEQVTEDRVLLHITNLQEGDAGEYACHTPNTADSYHGNYNAKVDLLVIQDTLVASVRPQTLRKVERDSLELACTVSKTTSQHTHLSVTWYLNARGARQDILSLSKDFVLNPGSSYKTRFASGDVRLDKTGETIYRLAISKLQASDQGAIHCEAIEWIQDPDGSWKDIARKTTEATTVNIESLDGDFTTDIKETPGPLEMGSPLEIACSVRAQSLHERFFKVSWLHNGMEVAQLDAYGVPTWESEYSIRESLGQLKVVRRSMEDYVLMVGRVGSNDGGNYSCEVSEMEWSTSGSAVIIRSKRSAEVSIDVAFAASTLEVTIGSNRSHVIEGQSIALDCTVSGTANPLSILWHLVHDQEQVVQIARLERDGSLKVGPSYLERHAHGALRVVKTGATSFLLGLDYALTTDGGLYGCLVTEWSQTADGGWRKLNEKQQEALVNVTELGTGLVVRLQIRKPTVQLGDTFDLLCMSSATTNAPISITWQYLPPGATGDSFLPLVKILHGGSVEWQQRYFQEKATVTWSPTHASSTLMLRRASRRDATTYRCKVEVLRITPEKTWVTAATARSHRVTMHVTPKKTMLALDAKERFLEISASKDTLEIDCQIRGVQEDSQLTVTWYILPPSDNGQPVKLLATGLDGVVEHGPELGAAGAKAKYHSERVSRNTYRLRVLQGDFNDQGSYFCAVEEWMLSGEDGWVSLGRVESAKTRVTFKRSGNNVHLMKANQTIMRTEGEDVTISCAMEDLARPDSIFSVTWVYQKGPSRPRVLLKMGHDMLVQYPDKEKARRVRFYTPSTGNYSLILQAVAKEDGGLYYCQVEEWRLDHTRSWAKEGADQSGFINLTVHRPAANIGQFAKVNQTIRATESEEVTIRCYMVGPVRAGSIFSITWFHHDGTSRPRTLLEMGHDMLVWYPDKEKAKRIRFDILSIGNYRLILQAVAEEDGGLFYCQVAEWRLSPAGSWEKVGADRSGYTHLTVHQPADNLRVNNTEMANTLSEGWDGLTLPCDITSRSSPASVFSVAWWKSTGMEDELVFRAGWELLFQVGNTIGNTGKRDSKLRFERLADLQYQLMVLRPEVSDSGIYFCRVEEWMLSPARAPYKISEKRSGNITVVIQQTGENTEATTSSQVCSSTSWVHFILVFLSALLLAVIIGCIVLWVKLRRLRNESYPPQKRNNRWVTADDSVRPISATPKSDEEDEGAD
ncbi:immunoglobulin superfamily member 2-like isoform X3 [Ambystoma mexicanum]|uniref:immunoglobulin superfamily member 2-like isoform X3 n=1 Tax=Ambystoma mexicanum TaxID=8296 RepID=UPI0037E9B6C4